MTEGALARGESDHRSGHGTCPINLSQSAPSRFGQAKTKKRGWPKSCVDVRNVRHRGPVELGANQLNLLEITIYLKHFAMLALLRSLVEKRKKEADNPREGWEDGTPPPHRDFKERSVVLLE